MVCFKPKVLPRPTVFCVVCELSTKVIPVFHCDWNNLSNRMVEAWAE